MTMTSLRKLAAPILVALALSGSLWAAPKEKSFASPEDAVKALSRALQSQDREALMAIFGPGYHRLETTDPAERKATQQRLRALFKEGWSLTTTQDQNRVIRLGYEGWSFPVPLVKTGSTWSFSTALGQEEIANRRVGHNELVAIETCQLIVAAETAFKDSDQDGNGKKDYTGKLVSTPGSKDGLYYAASGSDMSPLEASFGPVAAFTKTRIKGSPWFGYYFNLILSQEQGYVLTAWPANYGQSGIMSFWCDQSGTVYQKDLGANGGAFLRSQDATSNLQGWDQVD